MKEKEHYVNNKELYLELVDYLEHLKNDINYQVPNKIVMAFYQIAKRYSTTYKFSSYEYKEDFIQDSVIWCIKYINNFNPKYTNPFAYFTQYIHNCFLQRINSEYEQKNIIREEMKNMLDNDNLYHNIKDGKKKYILLDQNSPDKIEEEDTQKIIIPVLAWESEFTIK